MKNTDPMMKKIQVHFQSADKKIINFVGAKHQKKLNLSAWSYPTCQPKTDHVGSW